MFKSKEREKKRKLNCRDESHSYNKSFCFLGNFFDISKMHLIYQKRFDLKIKLRRESALIVFYSYF
jgi:hypothetical protein